MSSTLPWRLQSTLLSTLGSHSVKKLAATIRITGTIILPRMVTQLELIQVGAHARHLHKQIRNRVLLDIRVQKFVAQHGEAFAEKYLRIEESQKTQQRTTMYFEKLRYKHAKFILQYVHSLDEEKVLRLVDRQAFAAFMTRHQKNPQELPPHMKELARRIHTHATAHSKALVQSSQGVAETRLWRRRRRRGSCGRRRFWNAVGCAFTAAFNFLAEVFQCFGAFKVMTAAGYAKKFEFNPGVGVGVGFACNHNIDMEKLLKNQPASAIACGIGVVFGAVPGSPVTGGVRIGVGVGGGISCNGNGCKVGISVGAVASALIPTHDPKCVFGSWFVGFRCMRGVGAVVTAVCCQYDLAGNSHDCR